MEKMNDTMTICTLAKPDSMTIHASDYRDLVQMQEHYKIILQSFLKSMSLDCSGNPDIDYKGRDALLLIVQTVEPEAYNMRVRQLKKERDEKYREVES